MSMHNNKKTLISLLFCWALMPAGTAWASLEPMSENELADVSGQALFVADKIGPTGSGTGASPTDFTYYRIGMDADLKMNMNIDRLQLGCGGFNEGLVSGACDLDIDYVSFAGPNGPEDDFLLSQPYVEIAIENDGDNTQREVVGIKVGAATVEGIMSIGRVYGAGMPNLETGATGCNPAYGDANDNGSRLACHSGVNRLSGYLVGELNGYGSVDTDLGTADVCFGTNNGAAYNAPNGCTSTQNLVASAAGTRMQRLTAVDKPLKTANCGGLISLLCGIEANLDINESLRFLHRVSLGPGTGFRQTRDFFISFQRQQVAYPIFDQSSPYDTNAINGLGGSNSYSYPANTGWWMNITYAQAYGVNAGDLRLGGLSAAIDALSEGANASDINLAQQPLDNCFGAAVFC